MPAASELPNEERYAVVAIFDVRRQTGCGVSAALLDGLEAGGLQVLEEQVLVVVLAVDDELDLDEVAAGERVAIAEWLPLVLFDLLIEGLAARAFGFDFLIDGDELV